MAFKIIALVCLAVAVCATQQHENVQQDDQQQNRDRDSSERDRDQQRDHEFELRQQDLNDELRQTTASQQGTPADEYENSPSYDYSYVIQDQLTGDNKRQQESRRGGEVQGTYQLIDPDGFRRIVDYKANDEAGFNAEVRREPIQQFQQQPRFIRLELPTYGLLPQSFYTIREFLAPSYAAVRRTSNNQQNQNAAPNQLETSYRARLSFRSPGLNYKY